MTQETTYRAGVASTVITPSEPMWAAGYAHRDRPVGDKLHDLYAKSLVLEDAEGTRLAIVTTDLLGLPGSIAESVAGKIGRRIGLPRERIVLTSSHTHCGPVLRGSLVDIYPMGADGWATVERYSEWLERELVSLVADATADLAPVTISYGTGHADFAVNRRERTKKGVIIGSNPSGPVDHDVPVLRVAAADGTLRAVLFGYACHCATLDFHQWCGDYAGFAQASLEAANPGAAAMFVAGCGADVNPFPRRNLGLCEQHGHQLAGAVERVLTGERTPIIGPLSAALERVDLPFELPTRDDLERQHRAGDRFERNCAARLLAQLDAGQPLSPTHACPVQVLRLGEHLTLIALGGEVVADYALRLKGELGPERTWVVAYANDVFAYIPSRRMLPEGGYEVDTSMAVYGLPGRWSPAVEEIIVAAVHDLTRTGASRD